ncbi:hypothetical protein [Shewanella hanedai]|uniref:hypothetical protein n=1 Tax=Shewanella hanedai TaxID=25 RepID=UPI00163D5F84|nr:hypothetical protein [Shewanella hanedai]
MLLTAAILGNCPCMNLDFTLSSVSMIVVNVCCVSTTQEQSHWSNRENGYPLQIFNG